MNNRIVTIFIHGTVPPTPVLKIPVVQDFYFCPPGISRARDLDTKFQASKVAQMLSTTDPEQFDYDHFYLFGWSGYLRFNERTKAAQELATHIEDLKKEYEAQGLTCMFKVITHSHGGNVALSLKALKGDLGFVIDELILLACPVQTRTEAYAHDPLFKKVFSFYSQHDLLQVIDPQGAHHFLESLKQHGLESTIKQREKFGPLFSGRRFEPSSSVTQLNVRYANRELFHIEFLFPTFISALPKLLTLMKNHVKTDPTKPDTLFFVLNNEVERNEQDEKLEKLYEEIVEKYEPALKKLSDN